jgi:epoxyqueuosine reductase QueG
MKTRTDNGKHFFPHIIEKYKECDFSFIPIKGLKQREKEYFKDFMPEAKTAIVVYYPVRNITDWTWFCPDGTIASETCNIDDWVNHICIDIQKTLNANKVNTKAVPYPETSGLQFRFVAVAAGVGEIGRNAHYLHPEWGVRVHLRVLASELETDLLCSIEIKTNKVCLQCNKCVDTCPARAFENGFDGLRCRQFRKNRGEYIPIGPRNILRYCKKCVMVCKAGLQNTNTLKQT